MPKPILYMDVDGVLNIFERRHEHSPEIEIETTVEVTADGITRVYPLRVPAGTRERIEQLSEAFELVWATTWSEHAGALRQLAQITGFGSDWRVLSIDTTAQHPLLTGVRKMSDSFTLKLASVLLDAGDHAFAWADDILYRDAQTALRQRAQVVAPTTYVETLEWVGLTDAQVHHLLTWAKHLASDMVYIHTPASSFTAEQIRTALHTALSETGDTELDSPTWELFWDELLAGQEADANPRRPS